MRNMILSVLLLAAPAAPGERDHTALLKALPRAQQTLAQGLAATPEPEAVISAKFELGKDGTLLLSVYTAGKGVLVDAEHNELKEYLGSAERERWTPDVEVFDDAPHVARSATQLTAMSLSPFGLDAILAKAERKGIGRPFSITPVIEERRPCCVVEIAGPDGVVTLRYDLGTGRELGPATPTANPIVLPVEPHKVMKRGDWVVEFGCSGRDMLFVLLPERDPPARVVLVGRDDRTVELDDPANGRWHEVKFPPGFGPAVELHLYR